MNEENKKTLLDFLNKIADIINKIVDDVLSDFMNVRSFITLGLIGTYIVLVSEEKATPEYLKTLIDFLLGFWFGEKVAKAIANGKDKE